MSPQLESSLRTVDSYLAKYPTLSQYDRLRDMEKQTGYNKVWFFTAIVTVATTFLYAIGGMKIISDLAAFIYPAYASFKAIDSADVVDDTQWLTYWVVFSLCSIIESAASILVEWIPFYYVIKICFFGWLYHPQFMGAGLLFNQVVRPLVLPYLQVSEIVKKPQKKEE